MSSSAVLHDNGYARTAAPPTIAPVPIPPETWANLDAQASMGAFADLICANSAESAEKARAALYPVLPHEALVIVAWSADQPVVRIDAAGDLSERLQETDWPAIGAGLLTHEDGARRVNLADPVPGLRAAAWVARSRGVEVVLIVGARYKLHIGPAQERAAELVAMLAAARQRGIGQAPSPGSLAFSRSISQERDRVRWEIAFNHMTTLRALLRALRETSQDGTRATAPGVAMAIDVASQALLEAKASAQRPDATPYVRCGEAFAATECELREIARTGSLRLISGVEGDMDEMLPRAIARAGRLVSRAAALSATRHPGATKLRVHWRAVAGELQVTVADNGDGFREGDHPARCEQTLTRRVAGLGGSVQLDIAPGWGTAVRCRLPLLASTLVPETAAAEQIRRLRPREREVLELMVAGLGNREIAERLYITVRTVKFHVSNILHKFEVQSRGEVIVLARNAGITGSHRV